MSSDSQWRGGGSGSDCSVPLLSMVSPRLLCTVYISPRFTIWGSLCLLTFQVCVFWQLQEIFTNAFPDPSELCPRGQPPTLDLVAVLGPRSTPRSAGCPHRVTIDSSFISHFFLPSSGALPQGLLFHPESLLFSLCRVSLLTLLVSVVFIITSRLQWGESAVESADCLFLITSMSSWFSLCS